ncbi:hypothetical protein [Lentzea sp. NPDC004782]|uniref:alpha/beta hydrolase family protein n=1 Tax=Lentzea sp. NPDC004782 TaxID=3154458 RepID=UPI0033A5541B
MAFDRSGARMSVTGSGTAVSVHGGSEPGECFFAATRISDGDPDSWVREWTDLGVRQEQRARAPAKSSPPDMPDENVPTRRALSMKGPFLNLWWMKEPFIHHDKRPDDSGTRRPTLIMVGGGDTFVEDLCLYIGPAAVGRGYQVLLVDHVLSRPDVDPDTPAAFGISAGGCGPR